MKAALVMLMAICLGMTGCSTTRSFSPSSGQSPVARGIQVGDRASVLLKSGETRRIKIISFDESSITGREGKGPSEMTVQFALADVQSLEYTRGSALRTTGLILLAIGVGVAATPEGRYLFQCAFNSKCGD